MRFRGFSGGSIWLVALCLAFVLLNSSHKAVASEPGPDWMNGVMTLEVVGDSTWKDGDPLDLYGEKERVTANEHLGVWYDFAQTPVSVYAIQTLLGAIAGEKVLPVGLTQWQKLDNAGTGDSYAPNPSSSGMLIIKNNNVYYSGANRTLEYSDNWLAYFSIISTSYRGDVTRKPGRSADRKLTLPNGGTVVADSWGGNPRFSKNGDWLFVNTSNGQARVKVGNFDALYFAPTLPGGLGSSGQISNNGRFAAVMVGYNTLNIYDLNRCASEKPDYSQRDCQKRSIYDFVKLEYGKVVSASGKLLNDFRPIRVTFVNDATVEVFSSMMVNGVYKYVTVRVRVDPGSQAMRYLALGDSFSSGEGSTDYYDATNFYADSSNFNQCHQSKLAYSEVLNKWLAPDWYDSVACSGAMMKDVVYGDGSELDYLNSNDAQAKNIDKTSTFMGIVKSSLRPGYLPQLSLLKANPPTVSTITIGGNDIGFGDIVTACIIQTRCYFNRDDRERIADLIASQIPKLKNTYTSLKLSMTGNEPRLYVVGYPRIVNDTVGVCTNFMSYDERKFANALVDYLNDAIRLATLQAGVQYIDVSNAFYDYQAGQDYRMCGNAQQAINGLTVDFKNMSDTQQLKQYLTSSYHPNALGHLLLAKQIKLMTNNFTRSMPAQVMTSAVPNSSLYSALVGDSSDAVNEETKLHPDIVREFIVTTQGAIDVLFSLNELGNVPANITTISIEWHSDPVKLTPFSVSPSGVVSGSFPVPAGTKPGVHAIHIFYDDMSGVHHDAMQYVYVISSLDDLDGDGIPNKQEVCVFSNALGVDYDEDGKDDACDDDITEKPLLPTDPPPSVDSVTPIKTDAQLTPNKSLSLQLDAPQTSTTQPVSKDANEKLAELRVTSSIPSPSSPTRVLGDHQVSKADQVKSPQSEISWQTISIIAGIALSAVLWLFIKRKHVSKPQETR